MTSRLGGWVVVALCACYMGSPPPPGQTAFPPYNPPPTKQQVAAVDPNANRVRLDFDDEASLVAAGFKHNAGGTSRFSRGMLDIQTAGYEEWTQNEGFVQQAANGPWAVEARFAVTTPCARGGTGLWIHDGIYFVKLVVTDHEVVLDRQRVDIGATSQLRTYRVELANKQVTIFVDGAPVLVAPGNELGASVTLMFGVLGDGCAKNTSTWDYIAYETTPGPGAFWPPRGIWHAGTKAQPLIDALQRQLPDVTVPPLDDRDVPCVAIYVFDGAVRDLLPLAYDGQTPKAAKEFRQLLAMTTGSAFGDADRTLRGWTEPQHGIYPCDPAPGATCPPPQTPTPPAPIPAIVPTIKTALTAAMKWSLHPDYAEKSTAAAAKAYADARKADPKAAKAPIARLQAKLSSLTQHPKHCGL